MKPEEFIKAYENALATQNWELVEPLISSDASVTFSDGTVHIGKEKIQIAFENNFTRIKNEEYSIQNITWLKKEKAFAVYLFQFYWTGLVNEKFISGKGIGTTVIINEKEKWKLLTEHLGKSDYK